MSSDRRPAVISEQDQKTRELEVLAESSRLLTATLDTSEVLDRLAGIARRRLGVDVARIWLLDESGTELSLRAEQGVTRHDAPGKDRLSPRESLAGWVFTQRKSVALEDVQEDPRIKNREWFRAEGLVSLLCVPIMLGDSPIGILACLSRTPREFTEADVALAEALTAPAVVAVRNAAVYAEALERLEEIQALQRVTSETLSSPELETALRAVVREMRNLLRCDAAVCSSIDRYVRHMHTVTNSGARSPAVPQYSARGGEGLVSLVVKARRPLRSDDYFNDPRFVRTPAIEAWAQSEGVVTLIAAPVLGPSGEVMALLWGYNRTPTPFTARHEATLASLAQQAALAIGKAQAFEEERRRARQNAALVDIARACTSTLELGPLLKQAARRSALAVEAESCAIFLWRGGHLTPVMAQFADGREDPARWTQFKSLRDQRMDEVPAHLEAMRRRCPVAATRDPGSAGPEWFDGFGLASVLIVPLVSNDEVVGTMGLADTKPRVWSQSQMDLAMTIGAQVALAVDNARHYQDAQQRATEVETLAAIGETLTSTLDAQKVLDAITESATTLIGGQRAAVFELDEAARSLRARALRNIALPPGFAIGLGQGAAGNAAQRLEPVWSDDIFAHPLPGYERPTDASGDSLARTLAGLGFRAVLALPVISRGTALGAVCVYWDQPHRPDEREIRLLSTLARQAGIAIDNARLVGDLRRTLDDLRAAQETLVRGATLRAVGELAAGAAHHLNNLMAVVLGRTQLLLMRNPEGAMATSLRSIERAALDAADTVRRIQGFSATAQCREETRFDLNATVQEAVEFTRSRWQNEAKVRGVALEVRVEPAPLPAVSGRRAEICEVITNLMMNAIDALPEGGRIAVGTRAEPGRVVVWVRDSGAGMTDEVKRRAFEPFFTTKGVKRTGLGLAVAYGTIQRHSGQIAIEDAPGGGTVISFWLPAVPREAEALPAARPAEERQGSVLVIDDESDVRELVAEVLMSHGHRITVAAGGREGLARFETGRYDLVLTDLGMPDLNGWEVARAIKALRRDTPVLLLTGWADAVDPSAAGLVDGVLKKPFGLDDLAMAVESALVARA